MNTNHKNNNNRERKGHQLLPIVLISLMVLFSTVIIAPFFREQIVYCIQWVKSVLLVILMWLFGLF